MDSADSTKVELERRLDNAKSRIDELEREKSSLQQQAQKRVQSLEKECAGIQSQLLELQAKYAAEEDQHKKFLERSGQPCQNEECKKEKDVLRLKLHSIHLKPCDRAACVETAKKLKAIELNRPGECTQSECTVAKRELERKTQELKDMEKKLRQPCQRYECQETKRELKNLQELSSKSGQKCEKKECLKNEQELDNLKQQVQQERQQECHRQDCSQTRQDLRRVNLEIERKQEECIQTKQELHRVQQEIVREQQQECQRQACSQTRQDLDRVKQAFERTTMGVQRHECSQTRQELDRVKRIIEKMRSQPCNSRQCQNAQLALLNDRIGPPITSGDDSAEIPFTSMLLKVYNMVEKNQKMLQRENGDIQNELGKARAKIATLLKEPCTNQRCSQIQESLQSHVKELQAAFSAQKCTRPDCQKLKKELREKELQLIGRACPGDDMEKQQGGDHDELIEEFEYLTTDPDGILRVLEDILGQFEAKRLLSVLFQHAYNKCRSRVVDTLSQGLMSGLFTVLTNTTENQGTLDLDGASRGFGLLLHAFALKAESTKTEACAAISQEIYNEFEGDPSFYKVQSALQSDHDDWLRRVVQLTWRCTTLPTPMIMCQPDKFHDQIHEPEFGHWDKRKQKANDYKLVYLRPVVYRSYHGKRACKGWVAMEGVCKEGEKQAKAETHAKSDGKGKGWWPFNS